MATKYVASNGSNANSGTQASPYLTRGHALTMCSSGDTIALRSGDVFSGQMTQNKNGITWDVYGGSVKPIFSSFVTLSGWINNGNGVWRCVNSNLQSKLNKINIQGVDVPKGRYPKFNPTNHGFLTISNGTTSSLSNSDLSSLPNLTGAEVVFKSSLYTVDLPTITSHSGSTINFSGSLSYGAAKNGFGFFIQNHLSTLTEFGEWSYNGSTKTVYMYFGSANPNDFIIRASASNNCISASGGTKEVQFNNIILEGANTDGAGIGGANTFSFENVEIRHIGGDGINAPNHPYLEVVNSEIHDINNNGVWTSVGASNALVENNTVYKVGLDLGMTKGGLSTGGGYGLHVPWGGTRAIKNTVYDCGYIGIRFEKAYSECSYNHIHDVLQRFSDGGGIYNWNASTNVEFHTGMKCNNNFIHDIPNITQGTTYGSTLMAQGLYHDDQSAGSPDNPMQIYDNVVWNVNGAAYNLRNTKAIALRRNLSFNAYWGLRIVADSKAPYVENIQDMYSQDNIWVAKNANEFTMALHMNHGSAGGNIADWVNNVSDWNNNVYARPISEGAHIKIQNGAVSAVDRTLANWKPLFGWDTNSTGSPVSITNVNQFRLETNPTDTPVSISLNDGTYVDMRGVEQQAILELEPYKGIILIRTSDTPPEPTNPTVQLSGIVEGSRIIYPNPLSVSAVVSASNPITKVEFFKGATVVDTVNASPWDAYFIPESGNHYIQAKATDDDNLVGFSDSVAIEVYDFIEDEKVHVKINAGTNLDVIYGGETYRGDRYFIGLYSESLEDNVSPVTTEALFLTGRAAPVLEYVIPLPNGKYTVKTMHNEPWFGVHVAGGAGKRVFDINVQGQLVKQGFDIFVENNNQNTTLTFYDINVTDGELSILLNNSNNKANISGIEVFPFDGADPIKKVYDNGFTYNPTQDTSQIVPAITDVVQGESQMDNPATDVLWDIPTGSAKFLMDFERPTQTGSTIAGRTEHTSRYPALMQAEEMWFSARYEFPIGTVTDPEEEIIYQWHTGDIGGSPNFSTKVKNGRFVVYLWIDTGFLNQMAFDIGEATDGIKHSIIVRLKMHPTAGQLTVWKDGLLARCHNPITGTEWIVPTTPPGGGITNDYTAYPELGSIQQTSGGANLLVWNGKTARGTYPNPTKYPKWGFYKSAWGTRYNSDKSIKPEAYIEGDPLYVAPEFREKISYIDNVKFETRVNEFTNLEIYKSLDANGADPLETPVWWDNATYELEARENPMGWGTVVDLTNESPYPQGTQVELRATPETWTQFYRWSRDGVTLSTNQNYLYTTRGQNDLVLGEFVPKQYSLVVTVTPVLSGTVNISSGNYTDGQQVPLVATPNTGYTFLNWEKLGVVLSTNASYTHTKTAGNETIVANFTLAKHALTVTAGTGGSATGGGSFSQGETTSLAATVAEGYQFDGWYRDNVKLSGANPYTYTARNQPDTVQARFLRKSVAVIHADPESGTKPLTVQFSSSGSVADTYAWDFGNGSTSFLALPYTVYQNAGTYTVTLTTTYGELTDTATMEITVSDPVYVPPTIKITSPQNLSANFEAPAKLPFRVLANSELGITKVEYWVDGVLVATVTNAPYSYDWEAVPVGTYEIIAIAFDAQGSTESDPVSVTVYPPSEKYKLNGKELSDFGIIAGRAPNSNISVSGHLDFPKRMGKSFHVWDDEEGVEPYVSYDEIKFEGRDIKFHGYVEGDGKNDVMSKLYAFYDFLNNLNDEVLFSSKWGSWLVIVQSEVEATQIKAGMVSIVVTFRQTDTGIQPIQSGGVDDIGIDGINFGDLGFTYMNLKNQWYRPTTKDHHAIGYYTEPFQVTKAGAREMVLSGLLETETYQEMVNTISSLYSLFAKEGVRTLQINNEPFREFFVKDGFEVTNIIIKHQKCMALLSINMMELNKPVFDPDFFTDTDGNYILSNTNQKIIIRK